MKDKLLKIQNELKAPKNQTNNFGGYNYRSCEDIFEAVKPLLKEENLLLRMNDELVQVGDRYYIKATAILTDGNETIENTAYAREEETKKGMDGSQITGASSSYARKYALNGLFLIDDVKDSDSTNTGEDKEITKEEAENYVITFGQYKGEKLKDIDEEYLEWLSENAKDKNLRKMSAMLLDYPSEEEQQERLNLITQILELAQEKDIDIEEVHTKFKVNDLQQMTTEQMQKCVLAMKKKEIY